MAQTILIAYASGAGSTVEVAKTIGDVMRDVTLTVDVRPVQGVTELAPYSAAIVGSSIRAGRWLPQGVDFITRFEHELARLPVALFTTCLTMVNDTIESRSTVLAYMEPLLAQAPAIEPVGIGLFAGALDPTFRQLIPTDAGPYGDYRNWDAIRAWATAIRPRLIDIDGTAGQGQRQTNVQDLSHTILAYTDLSHSDLSEIDFQGSDLHQSNLTRSDLHGAIVAKGNLREANLYAVNLIGADFSAADLTGANLGRAILNGAVLERATLTNADLRHADLNWADLSHANLTAADLRHAKLGWTNLATANLTAANLQDALYNDYTQWPPNFSPEAAGCRYVGMQV